LGDVLGALFVPGALVGKHCPSGSSEVVRGDAEEEILILICHFVAF